MPPTKALLSIGAVLGAVALAIIAALAVKLYAAQDEVAHWKGQYDSLTVDLADANTEAARLVRERDKVQQERDAKAAELAARDAEEHEPVVKYITREVVRYVESSSDRVVLPAEWVRLYNASGIGTAGALEAHPTSTGDDPAAPIQNDASRAYTRRPGIGYSYTEQLELRRDLSPPDAPAGVGTGADL